MKPSRPLLACLTLGLASVAHAQQPAPASPHPCVQRSTPLSPTGSGYFRLLQAEIEALSIAHRTVLTSADPQKQQAPQDAEKTMLTLFSSLAVSARGYRCASEVVGQFHPENSTQSSLRSQIVTAYNSIAQSKDDLRLFTAKSLRVAETKSTTDSGPTVAEISHRRQQAAAELGLATVSTLSAAQIAQPPSGSPPPWSFSAAERTSLLSQLDRSFTQKATPDDFSNFADLIRSSLEANPLSSPGPAPTP